MVVEPVSLTVGAVVAALVAKSVDKASDQVVEAGASGLGRLVGWLREKLTGDRTSVMDKAVEEYDSPRRLRAFAEVIDAQVLEDPEGFGAQLQQRVDALQGAGVNVAAVTQSVWGDNNVAIANSPHTNVTYGTQPPATQPRL